MKSFFSKLFGTVNDRKLRELKPRVERINLLEPKYQKMTDGELQNQTKFFKEKLTGGIPINEILEYAFKKNCFVNICLFIIFNNVF